ncbi:hypothetical protein R0131_04350 [Clostridium sp. AL.422]|uniref:hypothetical protein n=1 Tax=Clostridium TaxID=1485 RepID=UPI00293DCDBF|nr:MULTISPECIES: hypothetical protein [unclassified Clostridium]MDV4150062.1 hypothetical protein [Clostridium sp. AL.422]
MEWIGWISLIIILCYSSYPDKVKKLEKKVKLLERNEKGDFEMSKIISSLVGEKCKIKCNETLSFNGSLDVVANVLDVDDEWIKISYVDKKGISKVKIVRIEVIDNIELISE